MNTIAVLKTVSLIAVVAGVYVNLKIAYTIVRDYLKNNGSRSEMVPLKSTEWGGEK